MRLIQPFGAVTLGQSMDGYAVVYLDLLLGVDRVVAFGLISNMRSAKTIANVVLQWLLIFQALDANWSVAWCDKVAACAMAREERPALHIVTGMPSTMVEPHTRVVLRSDRLTCHVVIAVASK